MRLKNEDQRLKLLLLIFTHNLSYFLFAAFYFKKMAPPSSTSFAAPPQSVPKKAQKTSGSTSNYIPYQNTPAKTNQQTWIPGGASKTPVQTSPWAVANSTSSLSANSVQPIVNAEPLPTETSKAGLLLWGN